MCATLRGMDLAYTEQQDSIRAAVEKICVRFDDAYWLECDHDGRFPEECFHALADDGWLGICIDERYGGAGLGIAPVSPQLALSYIAEKVLGLAKSY